MNDRALTHLKIFAFFFSTVLLLTSWHPVTGDDYDYALLTDSLARFHSWEIPAGIDVDPSHLVPRTDGKRYVYFPAGQSLVQLPLYFLAVQADGTISSAQGREFARILSLRATQAILTALAALLLFCLLTGPFEFGPRLSLGTSALYVFATQALPYSKLNYSEPLQAFLFMAVASVLFSKQTAGSLARLFACSGALVVAKPVNVLFLPVILGFFFYQTGRAHLTARRIAAALAAVLPFLAIFFYWNHVRTGNVFDYGRPAHIIAAEKVNPANLLPALQSLFAWPSRNIFFFNPILLLAVAGMFVSRAPLPAHRRYLLFAAGLFLLVTVVFGIFPASAAWGAWAWGPRYTMPLLALFFPFVAACLRWLGGGSSNSGRWRVAGNCLAVLIIIVSLYVQMLGASYSYRAMHMFCIHHDYVATVLPKSAPALVACDLDLRASPPVIHHYLFWRTSPEALLTGNVREFPWIPFHYDPLVAPTIFGSFARDGELPLFFKDYLFLVANPRSPFAAKVAPWLMVCAALSAVAIALGFRRSLKNVPA